MDWLGNVLIVIGLWRIGDKDRNAFIYSILGEACWIIFSFQHALYSLALICGVFLIMATRNWLKWRREENGTANV